ncbi:MAG: phosphate/phosphite/phosphonate ABC transporter substrate-binding protein [Chloroflexota bacterium]|nr:phosphate/phosphite/phosphonate ABC transporter substrate-binding protein [Chloroflexota bacterium]
MKRKVLGLLAVLLLALAMLACTATPAAEEPVAEEPVAEEAEEELPEVEEPIEEEEVEEALEGAEEEVEEVEEEGTLGTAENPVVMSFVPSGETQEILASGEEIATMIEERTGLEVEANVATSYAAVVEAMCAGNADVGWLNTFSYILANERCGVDVSLATVRFGEPFYTGQIVANADAGIETLEDIAGNTICWVDPLSTSGYIIPRVMVAAAGVDPDQLESQFAGSHPNVITAVYGGDCAAGATYVDARTAVEEEFPDVMEQVIIVAESPPIPNDTVAFSPDVPEDVRESVVSALLEVAETEEGVAALESVYEIEGFQEVDDSFYDEFRTELDASGISIEELAGE